MKVILKTKIENQSEIENLVYNSALNTLEFNYNGKSFVVNIEDSVNSYVKIDENDNLEIINQEAKGI